ncbi:rCG31335 [Rattus norvegicus]|uniref:RCG31335 n=1 Tax=Rattus norvegicus TaxID=10116 RepID=A6IUD5_RAT|nr:rCG31335 [Rattus norvegicus]
MIIGVDNGCANSTFSKGQTNKTKGTLGGVPPKTGFSENLTGWNSSRMWEEHQNSARPDKQAEMSRCMACMRVFATVCLVPEKDERGSHGIL